MNIKFFKTKIGFWVVFSSVQFYLLYKTQVLIKIGYSFESNFYTFRKLPNVEIKLNQLFFKNQTEPTNSVQFGRFSWFGPNFALLWPHASTSRLVQSSKHTLSFS